MQIHLCNLFVFVRDKHIFFWEKCELQLKGAVGKIEKRVEFGEEFERVQPPGPPRWTSALPPKPPPPYRGGRQARRLANVPQQIIQRRLSAPQCSLSNRAARADHSALSSPRQPPGCSVALSLQSLSRCGTYANLLANSCHRGLIKFRAPIQLFSNLYIIQPLRLTQTLNS